MFRLYLFMGVTVWGLVQSLYTPQIVTSFVYLDNKTDTFKVILI